MKNERKLGALVVGSAGQANDLHLRLQLSGSPIQMLGWIGPGGKATASESIQHLGGFEMAGQALRACFPEHVILGTSDAGVIASVLDCVDASKAEIWLLPDYFPPPAGTTPAFERGVGQKLSQAQRFAKRTIDLLVALPLTLLSLPLLSLLALSVKLDSPGPAVFKQPRVGEGGRLFGMFKLRTMRADLLDLSGREPKRPDDHRVTRVGRWLRRTSLDELPQLLNVLRGDLSLVGPRPEVIANLHRYTGPSLDRFTVPQGLTGLWQVRGRKQPMYEWVGQDLEYAANWSLWLDAKILLLTPLAVLRGEGAF